MSRDNKPIPDDAPGTFVALSPNLTTGWAIERWLSHVGIPRPVPKKDLHCTLIYSHDVIPGFEPQGRRMVPIKVHPYRCSFARFGPSREVLVLKMKSKEIERRHYQLKNLGFRTKYDPHIAPHYLAHMTLSYEYSGNLSEMTPFGPSFGRWLTFDREYAQPLKGVHYDIKDGTSWNQLRDREDHGMEEAIQ